MKTKLVAIAKNESCYLADWIHHHLYFGFDAIEIIHNQCTDNSITILEKIAKKTPSLSYWNGDKLLQWCIEKNINFQIEAYKIAYFRSANEFSHIMFLDIDEFWTPKDLNKRITDYLHQHHHASSISFCWHIDQPCYQDAFTPPISQKQILHKDRHVKSILSTALTPTKISIHNTVFNNGIYQIYNGYPFPNSDEDNHDRSLIDTKFHQANIETIDDAFILHRIFRSEIEYFASLHRGRPSTANNESIKTNRNGYYLPYKTRQSILEYEIQDINTYHLSLNQFKDFNELNEDLIIAQNIASSRASDALKIINNNTENYEKYKYLIIGANELRKNLTQSRELPLASIDSIDSTGNNIYVTGWAFDPVNGFQPAIKVTQDGREIYFELRKINREDVCTKYPISKIDCGFQISFHENRISYSNSKNEKLKLEFFAGNQKLVIEFNTPQKL